MDEDSIPSLERADSGGSSSSSSACSSLFSNNAAGDGADSERRSSFASSVFEEDDNKEDDIIVDTVDDSQETTPTPGSDTPSTATTCPSTTTTISRGMSLSRTTSSHSTTTQSSSDDGSSTSSHDSYVTTTNMATPTAELHSLSLHPITSTSSTSSTSTSDQTIAATREQRGGGEVPHYSNKTNNSIIISNTSDITSNTKQIPTTSPDMLRFAARVASRGVQFSPMRVPFEAPIPTSSSSSRLSNSKSSSGRTLNAEGFPWTARPSSSYSHSPRKFTSTSISTSTSRPSTSGSFSSSHHLSGGNTTYSSSYGGTPSAIFSTYCDEEDISGSGSSSSSSEEEEMEVLSELFRSNFSGRRRKQSRSSVRSATRDGAASQLSRSSPPSASASAASSSNSTSIHDGHTAKNECGASCTCTTKQAIRHLQHTTGVKDFDSEARMGAGDVSAHGGAAGLCHNAFSTVTNSKLSSSSIQRTSTTHNQSSSSNHTAHIRHGDSKAFGALHSSSDQPPSSLNKTGGPDIGHSSTPLQTRSTPGAAALEFTSTTIHSMSSSPSPMRTGTNYASPPPHLASASASPLPPPRSASLNPSASASTSASDLSRQDTVTARDSTAKYQTSTARRERNESLFRYEAPSSSPASSSSGMATALAAPPQAQQYQMTPHKSMLDTTASGAPQTSSSSKARDASSKHAAPMSISSKVPENVKNLNLDEAVARSAPASAKPAMNRHDTERRPQVQERKASLDYGDRLSHYAGGGGGHGGSSSLYGAHLNSLNYHAGSGLNSHATHSSRPMTTTTSSSSAYLSSSGMSRGNWTRPWVKDSDSSSIKSSSGLSSDGSRSSFENSDRELNVMSPAAPLQVPFLSTAPAPPGCKIIVEALQPEGFDIFITLPGFAHENITLALKKSGALHILADKYEDEHGHFERMVELGEPAKDCKVTAVFNGATLEVHVRKTPKEEQTVKSTTRSWPSSSSTTSSSFGTGSTSSSSSSSSSYRSNNGPAGASSSSTYEPPMYFGGTDPVAFYSSSPLLSGASYIAK